MLELPDFPTDMYCSGWSRNGARILCAVGQPSEGMWSLGAFDGSDPVRITANPDGEQDNPIGYSPDGQQIAFMRTRLDDEVALTIVDADGNNLRQVTDFGVLHAHESQSADWAADGSGLISLTPESRLVFVHADGSGIDPIELDLGTEEYSAFSPTYSPDSSRIAFAAQFAGAASDIYTADVDGSNVVQVTDTDDTQERSIDWTAAAAGQATAPSVAAPGEPEASPATDAAPVASSEPLGYASTSFVVPFEATIPASVQPDPTAEEPNFVTWESADGDRAIRFLAPVAVYPPGSQTNVPVPDDYLEFLMSQTDAGATFDDVGDVTVGGFAATIATATTTAPLSGGLGCQNAALLAEDCFGLQPDIAVRLAIVDVGDQWLVLWMRDRSGRPVDDEFAAMLDSVRFIEAP